MPYFIDLKANLHIILIPSKHFIRKNLVQLLWGQNNGGKLFNKSHHILLHQYIRLPEIIWEVPYYMINANARLYSPYLGRFVSPDPLLNSEGGPLDYNPYIYARNNPYKYIDRNGEFPWLLFGAALGAGFNIWQNSDNIHCFGDALFYGVAGAGAGAFGGWVGPSAAVSLGLGATGAISGVVSGAIAGYISSTTEGMLNMAYSGDPSKFSLGSIFTQTALSAFLGGVEGGMDAVRKNTNFFTGTKRVNLSGASHYTGYWPSEFTLMEVVGKYVGDFQEVPVFESGLIGNIKNNWRACTIPEVGIFAVKGTLTSKLPLFKEAGTALLQHEFGHILQYRLVGRNAYWGLIAKESFNSARYHSSNHYEFWTETWANYLSKEYFGKEWYGLRRRFREAYPAINISPENLNRVNSFK